MDIAAKLRQFLSQEVNGEASIDVRSAHANEDLLAGGAIDSMVLLRLVSFIEESFHIAILDEEISKENFQSLASMERLIQQKQS